MRKNIGNIRVFAGLVTVLLYGMVPAFAQNDSVVSRADGGQTQKTLEVGATSALANDQFGTFPDLSLTNMLQGKILGLQVRSTVSGLGNNTPDLYIRGHHGMSENTAIVVVDGVERPAADLIPEEIESIEVLKDATAKILFGPRAANGVVWITTRRGKAHDNVYNVSFEAGAVQMTRMAEYLDSYQYASLYNEARINDGLLPFYNQKQLEGYKNTKGAHDMLYPDVNLAEQLLGKVSDYRKVSFDMTGGTDKVRYALVVGYVGGSGFEDVAYTPQLNRLNLRGNLDFQVTDFLSVSADIAGRMESRKWGQLDCAQTFSAISSHRPNEYPLTFSPEDSGLSVPADGTPLFGGSMTRPSNAYAEAMYGGYTDERYMRSQTNVGLKFDLGMIAEGLKAGAFLSFDNHDYLQLSLSKIYPTYAIDQYVDYNGNETVRFTQLRKEDISTSQSRRSTTLQQTLGWNAYATYDNVLNDVHGLSARLAYMYAKSTNQGVAQDRINTNLTLRLGYTYDSRYSVEGDVALMGSNRFAAGNKQFLSAAGGFAWIASNEDFLRNSDVVDFLKFRVSAGVLGYDRSTDHLLYNTAWSQDGSFKFGTTNNGSVAYNSTFIHLANPALRWEHVIEMNAGAEAAFLGSRLYAEANYFRETHNNIVGAVDSRYGDYAGDFKYVENMGSVFNHGLEGMIRWSDTVNEWSYSVGANVIWSKNKLLAWDQVKHGEEYRYTVGRPTDAMMGLVSQGLFGRDVDLASHPRQTFADYQEGDIAYLDRNEDNVVDERDVVELGNSFPRTTLGVEVSVKYKGWGLYLHGYSELGVHSWATNAYYWNRADEKYSVLALDRYHPVYNPEGTYPRLTSTNGENNFRNSSFWLMDTSFFRLKNVELSYTFDFTRKMALNAIKVFLRGTNLCVLSSVKDLDPELLNAGVTNYPVTRSFTAGLSFKF